MYNKDIRLKIEQYAQDNEMQIVLIDGYDNSILGITDNGQCIYDYENMIYELMKDNKWSRTEAEEWYSYNTERALFSIPVNQRPIILQVAITEI